METILMALRLAEYSENIGFLSVEVGYAIGTISFIIVTIIWAMQWKSIASLRKKLSKSNHPNKAKSADA